MSILNTIKQLFEDDQGADQKVAAAVITTFVGNNKLSALNTAAQTAIRAGVTELDNGIDHLAAAFHSYETTNPLVGYAVNLGGSLLQNEGFELPSETWFEVHVKAAIADVAAALGVSVPAAPAASADPVAPPATATAGVDPSATAAAPTATAAVIPGVAAATAPVVAGAVPATAAVGADPVGAAVPSATVS